MWSTRKELIFIFEVKIYLWLTRLLSSSMSFCPIAGSSATFCKSCAYFFLPSSSFKFKQQNEHYSQSIFNLTCFNRDQTVDTLSLAYLIHLINKFVTTHKNVSQLQDLQNTTLFHLTFHMNLIN